MQFLLGCGHTDATGIRTKFSHSGVAIDSGVVDVAGPFTDGHYSDRGIFQNNTGFGRTEFRRLFEVRQLQVRFSFWLRLVKDVSTFAATSEFFLGKQYSLVTNPKKFSLGVTPDGKLNFATATAGPTGFEDSNSNNAHRTIRWESAPGVLSTETWNHFEFFIDLTGVGFYAWKDGAVLVAGAGVVTDDSVGYGDGQGIDEMGFCWERFGADGYSWSSFAMQKGTPEEDTFALKGRTRVTSQFIIRNPALADLHIDSPSTITPFYDSGVNPSFGTEPLYGGPISEHAFTPRVAGNAYPDFNVSYLSIAGNATSEAYFRFGSFYPVGQIDCLQYNAYIMNLSTSPGPGDAYLYPLYRRDSVIAYGLPITIPAIASPAYTNYFENLSRDPVANALWSEEEFADARWTFGFKLVVPTGPGLRISQLCIERLHLLDSGVGAEYSIKSF